MNRVWTRNVFEELEKESKPIFVNLCRVLHTDPYTCTHPMVVPIVGSNA